MEQPTPHGSTRFLSGNGSKLCSERSTTVSGECRNIQCSRFASWQIPPPTPSLASPLESRIPTTYPLRRVQLPTTLLNENVSPGLIVTPSVRALASRRLTTLLCCSAISSGDSSRRSSEPCFLTRQGSSPSSLREAQELPEVSQAACLRARWARTATG